MRTHVAFAIACVLAYATGANGFGVDFNPHYPNPRGTRFEVDILVDAQRLEDPFNHGLFLAWQGEMVAGTNEGDRVGGHWGPQILPFQTGQPIFTVNFGWMFTHAVLPLGVKSTVVSSSHPTPFEIDLSERMKAEIERNIRANPSDPNLFLAYAGAQGGMPGTPWPDTLYTVVDWKLNQWYRVSLARDENPIQTEAWVLKRDPEGKYYFPNQPENVTTYAWRVSLVPEQRNPDGTFTPTGDALKLPPFYLDARYDRMHTFNCWGEALGGTPKYPLRWYHVRPWVTLMNDSVELIGEAWGGFWGFDQPDNDIGPWGDPHVTHSFYIGYCGRPTVNGVTFSLMRRGLRERGVLWDDYGTPPSILPQPKFIPWNEAVLAPYLDGLPGVSYQADKVFYEGETLYVNRRLTLRPGIKPYIEYLRMFGQAGNDLAFDVHANDERWLSRSATGFTLLPPRGRRDPFHIEVEVFAVGTSNTVGWIDLEVNVIDRPDLLIKQSNEPASAFAINDTYQTTPAGGQIEVQTTDPNTAKTYQVKVENDGETTRTFVVKARESAETGWVVTYKIDTTDISSQIRGVSGYTTESLAPGSSEVITMEMMPNNTVVGGTSKGATIEVFLDGSDTTVRDAVRATTVLNRVPDAVDDAATTDEDMAVDIAVLANDTDVDGDTLTVSSVTQGGHGAVAINANNTVKYTPNANYHGTDRFTYTVSDGKGGTDTATVTVTVKPVNDAPDAVDDTATTDEDKAVDIAVLTDDTDVDGDPLTVSSVTQGNYGAVAINANGTVKYTPNADWNGTDSFTYTVSDGKGGTDTATVTVTVNPVNDAPEVPELLSPADNAVVSLTLTFKMKAADPEGDPVKFVIEVMQGDTSNTFETDLVDSGTEVAFTVPSDQALAAGQWTWRAKAVDSEEAESDWSTPRTFYVAPKLSHSFTLGLHLFTIPAQPFDSDPALCLQGISGDLKLARWNPETGRYVKYSDDPTNALLNVVPGRGFWCLLAGQTTLTVPGTVTPNQPFDIPVLNGWMMAGNPFNDTLPWSLTDLQVVQNGQAVGTLDSAAGRSRMEPYGWAWANGQYVLVYDRSKPGFANVKAELNEWEGVWLKGKAAGVALRAAPGTQAARNRTSTPPTAEAWAVHLSAAVDGAADTENILGMAAEPLEIESPPTAAVPTGGVDLSFINTRGEPLLAGDLRNGMRPRQTWHALVTTDRAGREVTLTWADLNRELPRSHRLRLIDETTGQHVLMNTRSHYTFRAEPQGLTRRAFTIELEPEGTPQVRIVNLVSQPTRGQGVALTVTLTSDADVEAQITNLSGQTVRVLPPCRPRLGTSR